MAEKVENEKGITIDSGINGLKGWNWFGGSGGMVEATIKRVG